MGRKKRACGFCKLFCESKKTGPLLEKEDVCAHELCMLYSSNLITKKDPEGDDFAGFLIEDVKRELKRGEKLCCPSCKRTGATIGCEIKKCKKSYHYLCAKKQKATMIENKVEGTFKLYCKNHASICPEGSGKCTGRDAVSNDIKEAKEVTSPANGSRLPNRNHTVNSRKRKKPTEKVQPDHEINQLSYDSESTDDSVDYAMPKNHKKSRSILCDLPEVLNGQPPHGNHQYENYYFGVHNHHTHASLMDEREAQSESTLDPMLSMPQCSSGKEEEFWQLCKNTGCVEKIFSKITDELTNVSMKITNHNASDNDYKFAFAVVMASGLLPQIMLENEAETDAKLESLLVQHKLLSQAKSAMQEVKTKMNQWQS